MDPKKKAIIIGILCLLCIIVIVIMVILVLPKKSEPTTTQPLTTKPYIPPPPTTHPTSVPTSNPATPYIQSTTDQRYLVLNQGQQPSTTKLYTDATPVHLSVCDDSKYCLMTLDQRPISIDNNNIVSYGMGAQYYLYINNNQGASYIGIYNYNSYLQFSTMTFISEASGEVLSDWRVVMH